MRKGFGLALMGIGAALIVAALALFIYNQSESEAAGSAAASVLPAVMEVADEAAPGDDSVEAVEVDGVAYIGYLTVPTLGLELPVASEWSYASLRVSPCRYFGSAASDDLVICAHNYARHFGTLKSLHVGDAVYFTGVDGERVAYEVSVVETLAPTQVSDMLESGHDLTLYTCTYGGQSRVTVRCDRA